MFEGKSKTGSGFSCNFSCLILFWWVNELMLSPKSKGSFFCSEIGSEIVSEISSEAVSEIGSSKGSSLNKESASLNIS